ncbi:nuclear transport factor 2 family protein [Paraglaciecola sp.]|uniref:nuclear transport factor 2 family protein n=1 Tax=Paraglaciecola sp. TaxID=1920173 RepID=UPI0030F45D12
MNTVKIKNLYCCVTLLFTALLLGACQEVKDPQTAMEDANLKKAIYCMDLLENQKNLEASRRECFGETYVQHTSWIRDGVDEVLSIFASRFEKYPDFAMEIKRSAADGDLVWMHLHTKRTPEVLGNAVINIFRMKDGKFVEHWNVGQPVPDKSANDNTMF